MNSFLQAIDAFRSNESVLVAASNHQYLLDPALWRRFDDVIEFPLPGVGERKQFLRYLLNGLQFTGSVQEIANQMATLSYADIEHVSVEAIKTMILNDRESLTAREIASELRSWKGSVNAAKRHQGVKRK